MGELAKEEPQIYLEKFKLTAQRILPKAMVKELRTRYEEDAEHWLLEFSTQIWSEKVGEEEQHVARFSAPADWWSHFKITYFPEWLLRRFPPKIKIADKVIKIQRKALFPKFILIAPEQEFITINDVKIENLEENEIN